MFPPLSVSLRVMAVPAARLTVQVYEVVDTRFCRLSRGAAET